MIKIDLKVIDLYQKSWLRTKWTFILLKTGRKFGYSKIMLYLLVIDFPYWLSESVLTSSIYIDMKLVSNINI